MGPLLRHKKILLTGGSGKLGKAIVASRYFSGLLVPPREILDITKPATLEQFFSTHAPDAIIHCAAVARMSICEADPLLALHVNGVGTSHLVSAVLKQQMRSGREVRFIHLSTDGVYAGISGNYSENDPTIPYNKYGWTKLGAECAVRMLSNYCIIRTSFFDPDHISYLESATDAYSSKVTLAELVKAIAVLLGHSYIGVVNIGSECQSDYERYKKFKPDLKPSRFDELLKTVPFKMARNASLDCNLWKKLEN